MPLFDITLVENRLKYYLFGNNKENTINKTALSECWIHLAKKEQIPKNIEI